METVIGLVIIIGVPVIAIVILVAIIKKIVKSVHRKKLKAKIERAALKYWNK